MRIENPAFDWFMGGRASLFSATIAIGLSATAFAEDHFSQSHVVWTTPSEGAKPSPTKPINP